MPKFRNDWPLYTLCFGAVIGNALFPLWLFQGTEKMKYISRLNMLGEFAYRIRYPSFGPGTPALPLKSRSSTPRSFLITGILGIILVFWRMKLSFKLPGFKISGGNSQAAGDLSVHHRSQCLHDHARFCGRTFDQ